MTVLFMVNLDFITGVAENSTMLTLCLAKVDAASGGFVAPFVNPTLVWDFRLPKVVSINVSGHKYGLVSNSVS